MWAKFTQSGTNLQSQVKGLITVYMHSDDRAGHNQSDCSAGELCSSESGVIKPREEGGQEGSRGAETTMQTLERIQREVQISCGAYISVM